MTDTSDKAIEALAAAPWAYASADLSAMILALQAERNQIAATAEADARVEAAVLAEREACATWHDREASAAMNSLHCGSENSEYRAANRLHDLHTASAAAIRSRGVTG